MGLGLINAGPFQSVRSGACWSGAEYAPDTSSAWYFQTYDGRQGYCPKSFMLYGTAVRSGDVAAAPEPGGLVMLLTGLGTLAAARRPRQHRGGALRGRRSVGGAEGGAACRGKSSFRGGDHGNFDHTRRTAADASTAGREGKVGRACSTRP